MNVLKIFILLSCIAWCFFGNTALVEAKALSKPKEKTHWILNTSNQGKMKEFKRLFSQYDMSLDTLRFDLKEIEADPVTVVAHKASQLKERVLVEDTSLDIEGANVGVNVRWLLKDLPKYVGRRATWRTLLAYQKNGMIYVYEGKINGTIIPPRGNDGFGFDAFFLPDNSQFTLAEAKPDEVNARAEAVKALAQERPFSIIPPITHWEGAWQEE